MNEKLLRETQVAELLNVAVQTLRNWRHQRQGSAYVKLSNRAIRYRKNDVAKYTNDRVVILKK